MKSCGKRFHDEVGKFRFLNELIKVVSPKVSAPSPSLGLCNHGGGGVLKEDPVWEAPDCCPPRNSHWGSHICCSGSR